MSNFLDLSRLDLVDLRRRAEAWRDGAKLERPITADEVLGLIDVIETLTGILLQYMRVLDRAPLVRHKNH
jgi:hypothetical protein